MAGASTVLTFLILQFTVLVHTEVLTPRYFNLASKKRITATATCGDEGPELYCKLVGANADHDEHVIQGQVRLFIFLCVNGICVHSLCFFLFKANDKRIFGFGIYFS